MDRNLKCYNNPFDFQETPKIDTWASIHSIFES